MADEITPLLKKVEEVRAQATSLREILDSLEVEVKKWASKRDSLNQKCKKIRKEITDFKTRRDHFNKKIKEFKAGREALRVELQEKRSELNTLQIESEQLVKKTSQSEGDVKRQIEGLDWKIQTNPLTLEEEAQIIDQIRTLKKQENVYSELSNKKRKITELHLTIATIRHQIRDINGQIASHAKESQENHEQMLERIAKVDEIKAEADQAHNKFLQYAKKGRECRFNYVECVKQIKGLTLQIDQIEEKKRKQHVEAEFEAHSKTAAKKLKEKKKLSFEEFKTLMEEDLI